MASIVPEINYDQFDGSFFTIVARCINVDDTFNLAVIFKDIPEWVCFFEDIHLIEKSKDEIQIHAFCDVKQIEETDRKYNEEKDLPMLSTKLRDVLMEWSGGDTLMQSLEEQGCMSLSANYI
jgi:hypothetical protein